MSVSSPPPTVCVDISKAKLIRQDTCWQAGVLPFILCRRRETATRNILLFWPMPAGRRGWWKACARCVALPGMSRSVPCGAPRCRSGWLSPRRPSRLWWLCGGTPAYVAAIRPGPTRVISMSERSVSTLSSKRQLSSKGTAATGVLTSLTSIILKSCHWGASRHACAWSSATTSSTCGAGMPAKASAPVAGTRLSSAVASIFFSADIPSKAPSPTLCSEGLNTNSSAALSFRAYAPMLRTLSRAPRGRLTCGEHASR